MLLTVNCLHRSCLPSDCWPPSYPVNAVHVPSSSGPPLAHSIGEHTLLPRTKLSIADGPLVCRTFFHAALCFPEHTGTPEGVGKGSIKLWSDFPHTCNHYCHHSPGLINRLRPLGQTSSFMMFFSQKLYELPSDPVLQRDMYMPEIKHELSSSSFPEDFWICSKPPNLAGNIFQCLQMSRGR